LINDCLLFALRLFLLQLLLLLRILLRLLLLRLAFRLLDVRNRLRFVPKVYLNHVAKRCLLCIVLCGEVLGVDTALLLRNGDVDYLFVL
jgi:hypothetical protein